MKIIAKEKSDFTIFRFGKSEIRVIDKNGEPWFVAQDVCDALSLSNSRMSLKALDDDEKADVSLTYTSSNGVVQARDSSIVSESGMYTLVLRCRDAVNKGSVPHAFRKWVTAEVLPAIRKHGVYEKPIAEKKNRQSTATQLTPLRQTAERLIATGLGKIYPDIWKHVHSKFDVKHIHQLTPAQVGEAVEYLNALEGEYLGKANKQMSLPISFPMSYFEKYSWMRGLDDRALSAPWRYPADMLIPNGDNPNPLGKMLGDMRQMGYEVEAALFQLLSLQHHLENLRQKIGIIERTIR
ncbi:BRO family protein [Pantoea sp. BAV 3049]|uniref:BRO-N domain-containing protein n=1 Tax=Pantoea sp. BAV 3049 TaxID=2654188 RepID=UPI00131E0E2E|nr:BRO family protein [Pantoea sp. BAV 3049]